MTKKSKVTNCVLLFNDRNTAVYFEYFGIEYIPQEVLNKIRDKSIAHNLFRIQDNDSVLCGFYCIPFIEYILAGRMLLDYTNLFSLNDYEKDDKIIYNYFKDKYVKSWIEIKKIDETRNYPLSQIKHNNLTSEKYKKTSKYLTKRHRNNSR